MIINDEQFHIYMSRFLPLEDNPIIAVAISGGADSLSLIFMLNRWIKKLNGEVIGITIDHRLRKESYDESLQVGRILKSWQIKHEIIPWLHDGLPTLTNISEKSRINRYKLMENYCKGKGILHLAIGHHLNDQAETIAMRKLRNSTTVKGMEDIQYMTHVRIIRPFLNNVYKQDLMDTLAYHNIKWIEDPSNKKLTYERNKIRKSLSDSPKYTHKITQLSDEKVRFTKEFDYLEDIMLSTHGYGEIRIKSLDHVQHISHILASFIMTIGANFYKISQAKIRKASKDLSLGRNISLGHCLLTMNKTTDNYKITITREKRSLKDQKILLNSINQNANLLWNNTILIPIKDLKIDDSDYYISLLQEGNMKKAKTIYKKTTFQDIPFDARKVLPCLYKSNELISILTMENNTIYMPPRPASGKKINVQYENK